MKTLTILALLSGALFCCSANAYTIFYLPPGYVFDNPVDNMNVWLNPVVWMSVDNDLEKKTLTRHKPDDTIVIDLNEVVVTTSFEQQSQECLQKMITYPEFAKQKHLEGVVAATIKFNKNGDVVILDSFGSDPQLEDYVLNKIHGMQPRNCAVKMNKPYNLRFVFRLY